MIAATYILPIRRNQVGDIAELTAYLRWLSVELEVIVVDGSASEVFELHAKHWGAPILHIPPDPDLQTRNGKVRGVLTGLRRAGHERIVIADDDVRYTPSSLSRLIALLDGYDVVRPQNYFAPLPWHARWDTARILLNRMTGGDWPGTLGVRRSRLHATGGYDGDVLFENLELVRTVLAAGGTEAVPLDLFVRRAPPNAQHFWSQRVRQAYDELARPLRLGVELSVLPMSVAAALGRRWGVLGLAVAAIIGLAECGRWRGNGRSVFPATSALLAPAWVVERAVCIWLALAARFLLGGVPYHGSVLARSATPMRELRRRYGTALAKAEPDVSAAGPA